MEFLSLTSVKRKTKKVIWKAEQKLSPLEKRTLRSLSTELNTFYCHISHFADRKAKIKRNKNKTRKIAKILVSEIKENLQKNYYTLFKLESLKFHPLETIKSIFLVICHPLEYYLRFSVFCSFGISYIQLEGKDLGHFEVAKISRKLR